MAKNHDLILSRSSKKTGRLVVILLLCLGLVPFFGFCYVVIGAIGLGEGGLLEGEPEIVFGMDPTPKWTPDGASIVFGHGDGRIYVVSADGSRLRSISEGSGRYDIDISPSISPDGSTIAYATLRHETGIFWNRSRHFEIVTAALDGSDRRRLTENQTYDTSPTWSPDGNRIAFLSGPYSSGIKNSLFVMSSTGLEVNQIVNLGSVIADFSHIVESPPSWSPGGQSLSFIRSESGHSRSLLYRVAYTVGIDGTALERIDETLSPPLRLFDQDWEIDPDWRIDRSYIAVNRLVWSPDGGHMAFARVMENGGMKIYVTDTDSSRSIDLPVGGRNISWSPDGLEIATESFIVKVDGSSFIDPRSPGGFATWSPDGSRIAINAQPATEGRLLYDLDDIESTPPNGPGVVLYTMNRDGTDRRILVEQNADGSLSVGNGRPLDDGRPPATIYFDGVGPPPAPFDIEQCSNGVVVPNPDENPMLVEDCKTLLRIRDSVAVNPPLNWSTDILISEWEGIGLTNAIGIRGSAIREVDLSRRYLIGVISPEFGNLSALMTLVLGVNQLSGDIPGELGNLTNLQALGLGVNQLSGEIPGELGNLTNLQGLVLGVNQLSGEIPGELGNLTNLQGLDLSGNELVGSIPAELGNLSNLEELRLSDNRLTSVPEELAMPSLRRIWLEGNPIEGCIPGEILEKMVRGESSDNPFEPCED